MPRLCLPRSSSVCLCLPSCNKSKYGMKITPLFITIDPQRDSPSQLKAYFSEFESRIVGLTGPISAVRQIAQVKASE
ncbi:Protein SCO1 homolog 2 mitochondrial [Zea mays]|uniref:Protein SCO1 homolog 2 mitochondrial n=1 Tax=Zea mays TaxID=4577 RepID=A0A1D6I3A8_MAIZE|nr:Protein SCO1 homolog 2 mitochondrial [Zea mays]